MEIKWSILTDSAFSDSFVEGRVPGALFFEFEIGEIPVDLVCRSKDERRRILCGAHCLEKIQCATRIGLEILDGIDKARRYRHLRSEVKHLRRIFNRLLDD